MAHGDYDNAVTSMLSDLQKRRKAVRGSRQGRLIQIMVGFDPAVFKEIKNEARANNTSFAEQVRQLVARGLAPGLRRVA